MKFLKQLLCKHKTVDLIKSYFNPDKDVYICSNCDKPITIRPIKKGLDSNETS